MFMDLYRSDDFRYAFSVLFLVYMNQTMSITCNDYKEM